VTSQVRELSYVHARDATFAVFCQGPYDESARYRDFMGWELATVPLLVVDDLGMRKLPHTAAEDLLELIMRRYERASTCSRPIAPSTIGASCSATPLRSPHYWIASCTLRTC
jgi:hypothetical protein